MCQPGFVQRPCFQTKISVTPLCVLLQESAERLAGLLEISDVEAGVQITAWLCRGIDSESAAVAAAKRGVDLPPIGRYSHGHALPQSLQLGFAALDKREIRRGVRELAIALQDLSQV